MAARDLSIAKRDILLAVLRYVTAGGDRWRWSSSRASLWSPASSLPSGKAAALSAPVLSLRSFKVLA